MLSPIYAVTDTETGGLSPEKNALLQVSIIIVDSDFNEIETFAHKILPRPGYSVEPGAAAVNGYTQEEWERTGMDADHADRAYSAFLDQFFKGTPAVGVAHNAAFDAKFLAHHMPSTYTRYLALGDERTRKLHEGWYCTMVHLKEWRQRCKFAGSNKLADLAAVAGYTVQGKAHDAMTDTRTCLAGMRWLQEHKTESYL